MSNNHWQSPNNQNGLAGSENRSGKSGLLSNYARQQQQQPVSAPLPEGLPPAPPQPPVTNFAPGPQGQQPVSPPAGNPPQQFLPQQPSQWNGPAFVARPLQMVQRWSNKMAAMRRPSPPVDPNPLVLYRGPQSPTPPNARPVPVQPAPWKRSHIQRIAHLRKRRQERDKRNHSGGKRFAGIFFSVLAAVVTVMLTSTAGYGYNFYQSELPQIQNLANMQIPQSTRFYDRHGTLLSTLYANGVWGESGRSTPISYNYLPHVLQDAQIATEDRTFWTNNGIDPQGMLRALQEYVSHGGQIAGGGSTMTQQLIKNLSKNAQDTFQRKASEAALAIGLTEQYPKWKVMEMYFNDTPYGAQEEGVEAAVEDYFGLMPQCAANHTNCVPGVAFLDRDLTQCKVTKPKIDKTTCKSDPMLALARAALLAGIPQNPTSFDPSTSPENFQNVLTNRVPYVLDQMVQDGMNIDLGLGSNNQPGVPITKDMEPQVEAMISKMQIIGFHQTMLAPHFVNWVISTLSNSLGNGDYTTGYSILANSGLNVYTTLDLNLEQFVEKDVRHNLRDQVYQEFLNTYGPLDTVYNVNDSAVVVEDAKTGEILAMDGSADYNNTKNPKIAGNVNAALSLRQPGSSIKPIVFAAAFEKGWYPGLRSIDSRTYFPDGGNPAALAINSTYAPYDYGHTYHNVDETIRNDLANSFNIPAIKALMYAGFDDVVTMARRLGITSMDEDLALYNANHPNDPQKLDQLFGPSLALGTPGISLLQMVGAYQVFANNGTRVPYHNILGIWDNYGRPLYSYDPAHPNGTQVLSPEIAFLIGSMLSDNPARLKYEFGGTDTLTLKDLNYAQVAAKTGTTDNNLDNWTIGYTSSLVVGVWSGNADGNDPMDGIIGITGAGNIWQNVIEYASGYNQLGMTADNKYPTDPFYQPAGVTQAQINTVNGLAGTGDVDWLIQGEQPQQSGILCSNPNPTPNGNGNFNGNNPNPCPPNPGKKGNPNG